MQVLIHVPKELAIVAIAHHIYYDSEDEAEPLNSRKAVVSAIKNYVSGYGESSLMDHTNEYAEFREAAEAIYNRYFGGH